MTLYEEELEKNAALMVRVEAAEQALADIASGLDCHCPDPCPLDALAAHQFRYNNPQQLELAALRAERDALAEAVEQYAAKFDTYEAALAYKAMLALARAGREGR